MGIRNCEWQLRLELREEGHCRKRGCGGQGQTQQGHIGHGKNSGLCAKSKGKPERGLAEDMSR